jgi:hypothetical protein
MKIWQAFALFFVTIMLTAVGLTYLRGHMAMVRCGDRGDMMHLPTKYSKVSGCYVLTKDGWRPVTTMYIEATRP